MKVKMGHNSTGECTFVTTKYSEMSIAYDILDTCRYVLRISILKVKSDIHNMLVLKKHRSLESTVITSTVHSNSESKHLL